MVAQEVSRFCFLSVWEFIRHTLSRNKNEWYIMISNTISDPSKPVTVWVLSHIVLVGHRCWGGTKSQQGSPWSLRRHCQVILRSPAEIFTGERRVKISELITTDFFPFQTLNSISAEKNSTVIFPLPIDLITNILHGDKDRDDKGGL